MARASRPFSVDLKFSTGSSVFLRATRLPSLASLCGRGEPCNLSLALALRAGRIATGGKRIGPCLGLVGADLRRKRGRGGGTDGGAAAEVLFCSGGCGCRAGALLSVSSGSSGHDPGIRGVLGADGGGGGRFCSGGVHPGGGGGGGKKYLYACSHRHASFV